MQTFIAILRGINVSGRNKLPMAALRDLCTQLGLQQVQTYIQSGNIVFQHADSKGLAQRLEQGIRDTFGFEVPVIVRTAADWEKIIRDNPLSGDTGVLPEHLHITFLAEAPDAGMAATMATGTIGPDRFILAGKEVYLHCPGGYGDTKLSNAFFEKKLKTRATTRNWKTVCQLAEMAKGGKKDL